MRKPWWREWEHALRSWPDGEEPPREWVDAYFAHAVGGGLFADVTITLDPKHRCGAVTLPVGGSRAQALRLVAKLLAFKAAEMVREADRLDAATEKPASPPKPRRLRVVKESP